MTIKSDCADKSIEPREAVRWAVRQWGGGLTGSGGDRRRGDRRQEDRGQEDREAGWGGRMKEAGREAEWGGRSYQFNRRRNSLPDKICLPTSIWYMASVRWNRFVTTIYGVTWWQIDLYGLWLANYQNRAQSLSLPLSFASSSSCRYVQVKGKTSQTTSS